MRAAITFERIIYAFSVSFSSRMSSQIELTALFSWAALPTQDASTLFDEPELHDALQWAGALPTTEKNEVLVALAARLPALDADKAATLLVLGGSLLEAGANPDCLADSGLAQLERLRQQYEAGQLPAKVTWRLTVVGLMAQLCRSAAARARLRQLPALLEWLAEREELSSHFDFVLQVAQMSDEEVLWVLFPAYETGLEVSVSQLNNVFHLLTLLQPLVRAQAPALRLRHAGPPIDPDILRYAHGATDLDPEATDYARFEWLTAGAYKGGPLDSMHVAWGEARVSALPRVRGRVVLLATDNEQRLKRSWDAGFFATAHDAIRPAVALLRVLPAAEVRQLLHELHPPAAPAAAAATPVAETGSPVRCSLWQRLWGK